MPNFHKDPKITFYNGANFKRSSLLTNYVPTDINEQECKEAMFKNIERIGKEQEKLYASGNHSLLIIFQAMDAAGKDSTIENVMTGINPQGCNVVSFKQPSKEELAHDFLWRCSKDLPQRGKIGIFNRSYYEEVLVCKVHPAYIMGQNIGDHQTLDALDSNFWNNRYQSIVNFEEHLANNGYTILKFFLNVGKEEQKNRFLARIDEEDKNWKFSFGDIEERLLWDKYMEAYESMIVNTATEKNPWFVIPADNKWLMQYVVSEIIKDTIKTINPSFPDLPASQIETLQKAKEVLQNEK